MRKLLVFVMVLFLIAIPVFAEENLICDQSGLLTDEQVVELEEKLAQCRDTYGFTPVFVSTTSFDGLDSISYAETFYDENGYPDDGILLLLSLEEGYWYILTSGACYEQIEEAELYGLNDAVLTLLLDEDYYNAIVSFCDLSAQCFESDYEFSQDDNVVIPDYEKDQNHGESVQKKGIGKKIAIGMAVGFGIGLIAVGIMLIPMKSVSMQHAAADYIRSDSMKVTDRRDIYLYSRVRRIAKSQPANAPASKGNGPKRGGIGGKL